MDPEQIWSSSQLPSLPVAAVRLLDVSKKDDFELDEVIKIIKTDPAVTARILKSANSSYFGFRSQINSIDRAVPLLGSNVVTSLALGFSLLDESMAPAPLADHYKTYWLQSIVQATTAELLSQCTKVACHSESFQTGLLLDIGHLAMLAVLGEDYLPVLHLVQSGQVELSDAEQEVLGLNHMLIGSRLAEKWRLPPNLAAAIDQHHASIDVLSRNGEAPYFDLIKVAAFSAAAGDYFCRSNKGAALARMHALGAEFFHFSETSVEQFLEEVRPRIDESAQLFHMEADHLGSSSDLMAEANTQLSERVLRANMESAFAVQRQQEIQEEKEELREKNEKLQHKALRDPLTGIYNRSFFEEAFLAEMRRTKRSLGPVGVIFTDIDHFKKFNDTFGHLFGDHVIKHVAEMLQSGMRSSDTLARYGGEEFVMLIHQPSVDVLATTAERLRAAIESATVEFDGRAASVTASFGAAMTITQGEDQALAKSLLEAADQALYDSKRAGRNRVHVRQLANPNQSTGNSNKRAVDGLDSPAQEHAPATIAAATLPAESTNA